MHRPIFSLILTFPLLFPTIAWSHSTFAELKLNTGMEVRAHGTKFHKTGTKECNPFGRSPTTESFNVGPYELQTSTGDGRFTESEVNREYDLRVAYADGYVINPRNLRITVNNVVDQKGIATVSVKLHESRKLTQADRKRDECSETQWNAAASKDSITGSIRFGFTMPAHTWAVKVTRLKPTGVFALSWHTENGPTSPLSNALNSSSHPKKSETSFVVWAKPGTEISQEISFDHLTLGKALANGTVGLRIEPLAATTLEKFSDLPELNLNSVEAALVYKRLLKTLALLPELYDDKTGATPHFIRDVVSLIARPDALNRITTEIATSDLYSLTKKMTEVAYGSQAGRNAMDIKIAASLMGHELALRLLKDIGPYCEKREVVLPYSGTKIQTIGLRMAGVYLSRALSRLENYRFSHYQAYLEQIVSYEKANLTYGAVRTDAAKFAQMRQAYAVLRTALGGHSTPFAAALDEVKYVLSQFRSVGASESTTKEIVENLMALAAVETKFIQDFNYRLRAFKASNPDTVKGSDLAEQLSGIVTKQNEVILRLRNNVRFLSVEDSADIDSFIGMMLSLITENVQIFTKPLQWSEFENIRKAYLSDEVVRSTVNQANKCITDGVQ